MLNKFYLLLILQLFSKNNKVNILNLNLKLNFLEKKIFLNFFFFFKKEMEQFLLLFKNDTRKYISFYGALKYLGKKKKQSLKNIKKNSFFYFQLKLFDINYSIKNFEPLINSYFLNFIQEKKSNINYYNKYYIDLLFKRRSKVSVVSIYFLKLNFIKILKFIINSSFINLKPLLVSDYNLDCNTVIFNKYLKFINKRKQYDYIFLLNPFIKIKFLNKVKRFNAPVFSIVDDSINMN
jgi:hypothetical protein